MRLILVLTIALSACLMSTPLQAHLMVAQRGTLNFVDGNAYMVLSLPVTAFDGLDDDRDGAVTMIEFNRHRSAIIHAVIEHVSLGDETSRQSPQGIVLSPVIPHDADQPDTALDQVVVMGRFAIDGGTSGLRFKVGLYGAAVQEQSLEITAIRKASGQRQVFDLTPTQPVGRFFVADKAATN